MAGRIDFLREAAPRISTIPHFTDVLTMAASTMARDNAAYHLRRIPSGIS